VVVRSGSHRGSQRTAAFTRFASVSATVLQKVVLGFLDAIRRRDREAAGDLLCGLGGARLQPTILAP
jgi:hypothetical protein